MSALYHYRDCPYCFRVRAYLAERSMPYTSAVVERGTLPPEIAGLTPLGRLPLWVTDEGKAVFGSSTIVSYLDAILPDGALIPSRPLARARCSMAIELVDEGLLAPLLRLDREIGGRSADQWDVEVYRVESARIRRTLRVFEELLGDRQWLLGDELTPAELALVQPLTILERYGLDLVGLPRLAGLAERLSSRPSIQNARKA